MSSRKPRSTTVDMDSVFAKNKRSEQRWQLKNREVIKQLELGYSNREVADLLGMGIRQVRDIRERLEDNREVGND